MKRTTRTPPLPTSRRAAPWLLALVAALSVGLAALSGHAAERGRPPAAACALLEDASTATQQVRFRLRMQLIRLGRAIEIGERAVRGERTAGTGATPKESLEWAAVEAAGEAEAAGAWCEAALESRKLLPTLALGLVQLGIVDLDSPAYPDFDRLVRHLAELAPPCDASTFRLDRSEAFEARSAEIAARSQAQHEEDRALVDACRKAAASIR